MSKVIYVNPCHGNEPYLLGTALAKKIREKIQSEKVQIIVPWMYGKRQKRIMQEEQLLDDVILEEKIGNAQRTLCFSDNDFNSHMNYIIDNQEDVQKYVRKHLSETYGKIDLEISVGSRIGVDAPTIFAFPVIISQLLRKTFNDNYLQEHISAELLEKMLTIQSTIENSVETFFIPQYNTFSYNKDRISYPNEVSTPPLARVMDEFNENVPAGSVYCMLSGTGSEIQETLIQAKIIQDNGSKVYVPPWSSVAGFDTALPNIMTSPNLVKVISRPGWGTLWQCQVTNTKLEPLPYTNGDDPEIYFNIKTLAATAIEKATEVQQSKFGSLDGLEYIANKSIQYFE